MASSLEEEELDYHVTFPPAIGGTEETCKCEPVVILLGWAGCVDKHLAKYSIIYQSKGYSTIRYTAPITKIHWDPDSLRETSFKLLELLFDLGLEENPIIFHIFSNGGSFLYRHCLELMTNGENAQLTKLNLVGSILDSTPAEPSPLSGMKAIYHSRHAVAFATFILTLMFFALLIIVEAIVPTRFTKYGSLSTFMKSIENNPSKRPQLFLYSKKDLLCSYKRVEEVIAKRQAAGVDVRQVCFEDSDHVAHFVKYREQYMDTVLQFVQYCLDN